MDRKSLVTLLLVLLGAGVGAYGSFTDTGPVGWLNALQQRLFGSYYGLVSFGLVMAAIALVGGALWDGLARLMGREPDGVVGQVLLGPGRAAPPPPPAPGRPIVPGEDPGAAPAPAAAPAAPSAMGGTFFAIAVVCSALAWIIGGALYLQKTRAAQEDATATYAAVTLTDGAPLPPGQPTHLALQGIPVPEIQVVHHTDGGSSQREDYSLQPVVGIGWKPGSPVAFILRLDSGHRLPAPDLHPDWSPRNPREVRLLVRRGGPVPTPAVPEFKKMGVPLAADAALVLPVETRDGKPALADTSLDRFFMQALCGGITAISVILSLALWLRRRYDLKKAGQR